VDQDQYREQQKEANRGLAKLIIMISALVLGWKNGREIDYDPRVILGCMAIVAILLGYQHLVARGRLPKDTFLAFIAMLFYGGAFGYACGMIFGVFD
jgi:hypothetical protein